jgi:uncharacterized protein
MLDRRRSTPLDRLGRSLAGQPVGLRLGVALAGFVLFVGLSSLAFVAIGGKLGFVPPPSAVSDAGDATPESEFDARLERVTDVAKGVFLDAGLSIDQFLTRHDQRVTVGRRTFKYRYWDVWIPEQFDLAQLLAALRTHRVVKQENVEFQLETNHYDEKTSTIEVYVDGINTHRLWFTKAKHELPEGARVLLAYVPDNVTKIDIGRIPSVKYQGPPKIAIIIDDIGMREAIDHLFLTLKTKIDISVLPYGPTAVSTARLASKKGFEVMLHQPMEPINSAEHEPGRGKLTLAMNDDQITAIVEQNLGLVPHIKGVNNHMGSAFTRNAGKIGAALAPLKGRKLFFVDSVTIGDSVGFQVAQQLGVRSAARNVFIDNEPSEKNTTRQVELLGRIARAQGQAIGIGHPFQTTFLALQKTLPKLIEEGIRIVPVSHLVR